MADITVRADMHIIMQFRSYEELQGMINTLQRAQRETKPDQYPFIWATTRQLMERK